MQFLFLGFLSYSGDLLRSAFVRRRVYTFEHFQRLLCMVILCLVSMGEGEHKS